MARFTRFEQKMEQSYASGGGNSTHRRQTQPPAILQELAAECGVIFNGDAPWDIQVHSDEVYQRILSKGSLGVRGKLYGWSLELSASG